MRKAGVWAAALLCCLGGASAARASPSVKLRVRATPVSRAATHPDEGEIPRTGNIAAAGADLEALLSVAGTEYGGVAPPITQLRLHLPAGIVWNADGFAACDPSEPPPLVSAMSPLCANSTLAGRNGAAGSTIAFGNSTVPETLSVGSYYAVGDRLDLDLWGHDPVLIEYLARGSLTATPAGTDLELSFPLIETVFAHEPYLSVNSLSFHLGTATGSTSRRRFSLTMPRRCRRPGLLFGAEAVFAEAAGLPRQTAVATYRAPCPRRR